MAPWQQRAARTRALLKRSNRANRKLSNVLIGAVAQAVELERNYNPERSDKWLEREASKNVLAFVRGHLKTN